VTLCSILASAKNPIHDKCHVSVSGFCVALLNILKSNETNTFCTYLPYSCNGLGFHD